MKLKLINILPAQTISQRIQSPMLVMPIIAGLTPEYVDIEIEDIIRDQKFKIDSTVDLVGISAMTYTANYAYMIAQKYREIGKKVVIGGIHASVFPDEALNFCDSVVVGEAELVWKSVINDFLEGNLKPLYKATSLCSMDVVPDARLDLVSTKHYTTSGTIHTTRGCPYNCSFCSVTNHWGNSYRIRSVDKTIEEIEHMKSTGIYSNYLFFADDNIACNKKYTKTLLNELKGLNIKWGAQCNLNIADDEELLQLIALSGCVLLYVGIETISTENLVSIKKTMNKVSMYEEQIKKIRDAGILIANGMIVGFDGDDEDAIDRTEEFMVRNNIDFPGASVLTPLPGTVIYEEMERENRLITKDWSKYCFQTVVFKPKLMSPELLQRKLDRLNKNMQPRFRKGIEDFVLKTYA